MLSDLTQNDFAFLKKYAQGMRTCHETEFVKRLDPDLLRAMYRGKMSKGQELGDFQDDQSELLAFSRLFQATNTLLPNLYYQNPYALALPRRGADADSAALMSSILNYYMKLNDAKRQNQEAVLNAWFFGIGWKKIGYRTVFMPKTEEPETAQTQNAPGSGQGILGKMVSGVSSMFGQGAQLAKPDNTESRERPQLVDYETLFNDSENPMNVMLDHKADLLNCKAILHRLSRTVYDLENYGDYEQGVLDELLSAMKNKFGSRFDSRETELNLNELHVWQRNGIWILTWVDEWEKPLRYEKSTAEVKGFLFEPLTFTCEPGVRYPISHMKVASQVQTKLDKLATMYIKLISRSVNLTCVNEKALSHGQMNALEKNLLRGLLTFKGPISPTDITSFTSNQVPADLQNLMGVLQQNITEIMGADEQMVAGNSKNKTLGQDELARTGTKIRESGMQDKVRDFMINQLRKEGVLIKQFSNAELHLQITGKDYADPMTGQRIEDKWVEFMTEANPIGAKAYLQGEFDYDISIEDAIKPNRQAQRQQLMEVLKLASLPEIQQANLQRGVRIKTDLITKQIVNSFDSIGSPEQFIEKLDPMQVAAIQAQQVLMQNGGMVPQKNISVGIKGPKAEAQESEVSNPSSQEAMA